MPLIKKCYVDEDFISIDLSFYYFHLIYLFIEKVNNKSFNLLYAQFLWKPQR